MALPRTTASISLRPYCTWVNSISGHAITGMVDNTPFKLEPKCGAAVVISNSKAVDAPMRSGTSQGFCWMIRFCGVYSRPVLRISKKISSNNTATLNPTLCKCDKAHDNKPNVNKAAVPVRPKVWRLLRLAYTQYAAITAAKPGMAPKMAVCVKPAPCSTAKNVKITPEVSGNPDSKPPQNVPHFFAAMDTPSISTGVRKSLMRKTGVSNMGVQTGRKEKPIITAVANCANSVIRRMGKLG